MALMLVRVLAGFLAVEVADTPIFCADERPLEISGAASSSAATPSGDLQVACGDFGPKASADCFCPCHMSFSSEASFALRSVFDSTENAASRARPGPLAPSRKLDHPPQNLG
jgi:hypothetical protein